MNEGNFLFGDAALLAACNRDIAQSPQWLGCRRFSQRSEALGKKTKIAPRTMTGQHPIFLTVRACVRACAQLPLYRALTAHIRRTLAGFEEKKSKMGVRRCASVAQENVCPKCHTLRRLVSEATNVHCRFVPVLPRYHLTSAEAH